VSNIAHLLCTKTVPNSLKITKKIGKNAAGYRASKKKAGITPAFLLSVSHSLL
jgi:hypothetical protein